MALVHQELSVSKNPAENGLTLRSGGLTVLVNLPSLMLLSGHLMHLTKKRTTHTGNFGKSIP